MKKTILFLVVTILISSCSTDEKSSIEWTQDDLRITDLKSIQVWLDTFYQDSYEYPVSLSEISSYMLNGLPVDVNDWTIHNGCTFWYKYEVLEKDWIPNDGYRLSTCLMSTEKQKILKNDNWIYDNRYEIGVW